MWVLVVDAERNLAASAITPEVGIDRENIFSSTGSTLTGLKVRSLMFLSVVLFVSMFSFRNDCQKSRSCKEWLFDIEAPTKLNILIQRPSEAWSIEVSIFS